MPAVILRVHVAILLGVGRSLCRGGINLGQPIEKELCHMDHGFLDLVSVVHNCKGLVSTLVVSH